MCFERFQDCGESLSENTDRDHFEPGAAGHQSDSTHTTGKEGSRDRETLLSKRTLWYEHASSGMPTVPDQTDSLNGRSVRLIDQVDREEH